MTENSNRFLIAQMSDLHCGDVRFDHQLLTKCIDIINRENPDLTVIAGDLTATGYRDEFEEAAEYIDLSSALVK